MKGLPSSRTAAAAVLALVAAACGKPPPPPVAPLPEAVEAPPPPPPVPPPAPKTLADRLGGRDAIYEVVDEFLKNVAADTRVNKLFTKTKGDRLEKFKNALTDQICELAGGPCKYEGKEMKPAHKGMGISEAQWDAFIEDLTLALQAKSVGEEEKSELFALLGRFRDEVVEKKAKK